MKHETKQNLERLGEAYFNAWRDALPLSSAPARAAGVAGHAFFRTLGVADSASGGTLMNPVDVIDAFAFFVQDVAAAAPPEMRDAFRAAFDAAMNEPRRAPGAANYWTGAQRLRKQ